MTSTFVHLGFALFLAAFAASGGFRWSAFWLLSAAMSFAASAKPAVFFADVPLQGFPLRTSFFLFFLSYALPGAASCAAALLVRKKSRVGAFLLAAVLYFPLVAAFYLGFVMMPALPFLPRGGGA